MIHHKPHHTLRATYRQYRVGSGRILASIFVVLIAGIGFAARATWNGPASGTTPFVYPVGFVLPLNTSAVDQTKSGPLTLRGTTTANAGLVVGSVGVPESICWNGVCRSSWTTAGSGSFVRLQTGTFAGDDIGNVLLTGPAANISPAALRGAAKNTGATFNPGVGIEGFASDTVDGFSAGVAGYAAVDRDDHYGIYATNGGSPNVIAADFKGHVSLEGSSDLVIGVLTPAVTAARANGIPEICLNGSCKSAWEIGGRSEWVLFAGATSSTLWPNSTTRSLSVGNGTFTVVPYVNSTVDLTVTGDAAARYMVIGSPTSYLSGKTCGDRICNLNETAASCAIDCDKTPPAPVQNVVGALDVGANTVRIEWSDPSSSGFAGTRVVWKVGTPPADLLDGSPRDVAGAVGGNSSIEYTLANGTHCFGLYAYDVDAGGTPLNFSAGVEALCVTLSGGGSAGEFFSPEPELPGVRRR